MEKSCARKAFYGRRGRKRGQQRSTTCGRANSAPPEEVHAADHNCVAHQPIMRITNGVLLSAWELAACAASNRSPLLNRRQPLLSHLQPPCLDDGCHTGRRHLHQLPQTEASSFFSFSEDTATSKLRRVRHWVGRRPPGGRRLPPPPLG